MVCGQKNHDYDKENLQINHSYLKYVPLVFWNIAFVTCREHLEQNLACKRASFIQTISPYKTGYLPITVDFPFSLQTKKMNVLLSL